MERKETNPKDAIGVKKPRSWSSVSWHVLRELGIAMLEGARKYGRHNYRVAGVRCSVYFDAAMDHMTRFYEGEDIDPDSGLPHIVKAMASLAVLRDGQITGNWVDDRPPRTVNVTEHIASLQPVVDDLFARTPNPVPAYTELNRGS